MCTKKPPMHCHFSFATNKKVIVCLIQRVLQHIQMHHTCETKMSQHDPPKTGTYPSSQHCVVYDLCCPHWHRTSSRSVDAVVEAACSTLRNSWPFILCLDQVLVIKCQSSHNNLPSSSFKSCKVLSISWSGVVVRSQLLLRYEVFCPQVAQIGTLDARMLLVHTQQNFACSLNISQLICILLISVCQLLLQNIKTSVDEEFNILYRLIFYILH